MSGKQVDFEIKAAGGKIGTASLSGIPDDLWARFVDYANEVMPEKAPDAWASVLSEVVASMGGGGTSHTLIMTDIPLDAADALEGVAAEVDETSDGLIAQMYRYAQAGAFHVVRMHDEQKQASHLVMLHGIPVRHWEAWAKLAAVVDQTPESLFGLLLQMAEKGEVKVDKTEHGTPPPNSYGTRVGRQAKPAAAASRPN